MPVTRPEPPDTSSDGIVSYQTDAIREVAAKIIANVSIALENHTNAWNAIQSYLGGDAKWQGSYMPALNNGHIMTMDGSMPDVYYYLRNVLEPHVQRLRASFDLQLGVAQALFDLADQIDAADEKIKDSFRDPNSSVSSGDHHGFVP